MRSIALAFLGAIMLAACSDGSVSGEAPSPTVQEAMTKVIAPQSQLIQNMAVKLYNEDGEVIANRLTPADWRLVIEAAVEIETASLAMARADELVIAREGMPLQGEADEDGASADEVRAYIDADPREYKRASRGLAGASLAVKVAAERRDAISFDEASLMLGETCSSCHDQFWTRQDDESHESALKAH